MKENEEEDRLASGIWLKKKKKTNKQKIKKFWPTSLWYLTIWPLFKDRKKECKKNQDKNIKRKKRFDLYLTVWPLSKSKKRIQKEPRKKHQEKKGKRFDRLASGIWPPGLLSDQVDTINYLSLTGKSSQRVIRRGNTTKAKYNGKLGQNEKYYLIICKDQKKTPRIQYESNRRWGYTWKEIQQMQTRLKEIRLS